MPAILRNKPHSYDPVWHVQLTMVLAIVLQMLLPDHYALGSHYGVVGVEVLLLIALSFTTPKEPVFRSLGRRINVLLLLAVTAVVNLYALGEVANRLLQSGHINDGRELILTALNIYITNIVIFALYYWEMDAGGPGARRLAGKHEHDFLFPQTEDPAYKRWQPTFIDYLYVSSTNAMAFSPTDTLPLTRRAKMLMLVQSGISLVAIALVAARAVNILN